MTSRRVTVDRSPVADCHGTACFVMGIRSMSGTGGAVCATTVLRASRNAFCDVVCVWTGFGHDQGCLPISRESGTFWRSAVFFAVFAVALEEIKGLVGAARRPGNIGSQKLLYVGGIGGTCDAMRCETV